MDREGAWVKWETHSSPWKLSIRIRVINFSSAAQGTHQRTSSSSLLCLGRSPKGSGRGPRLCWSKIIKYLNNIINSSWSESRLSKHAFQYIDYKLVSHANLQWKGKMARRHRLSIILTIFTIILEKCHAFLNFAFMNPSLKYGSRMLTRQVSGLKGWFLKKTLVYVKCIMLLHPVSC